MRHASGPGHAITTRPSGVTVSDVRAIRGEKLHYLFQFSNKKGSVRLQTSHLRMRPNRFWPGTSGLRAGLWLLATILPRHRVSFERSNQVVASMVGGCV